jgi:molybdenum cofactor synthesis domain-containing protein
MNETVVTACVLIIGNEILSGRTQDTNLQHLARTLNEWGIRVTHARVIPDVADTIIGTLNEVRRAYDYVFTTGGIGPTHDDITAECVAAAFGVPLVEHPEIAARIRTREAPPHIMEARLRMARVPRGAGLIENATGGPQGFYIDNVYVMAGIPIVMQNMIATLAGKLRSGKPVRSRSVTVYLGESTIASPLAAIQSRYLHIDLGSYPFTRDNRFGTTLVMRGTDYDGLDRMLAEVNAMIVELGAVPEDVRVE